MPSKNEQEKKSTNFPLVDSYQDISNEEKIRWDDILSGKSYPDKDNSIEQKAHRIRQVILWKSAQETSPMPIQEAENIYANARYLYRKRQRKKYVKYSLVASITILFFTLFLHFFS
jgi:hypothetical protein